MVLPSVAGHGGAGTGTSKWHVNCRPWLFIATSVMNGPSLRNTYVMSADDESLVSTVRCWSCTPLALAGSTRSAPWGGTGPPGEAEPVCLYV